MRVTKTSSRPDSSPALRGRRHQFCRLAATLYRPIRVRNRSGSMVRIVCAHGGSVTQCWRRDGRRLGDGPDTGSGDSGCTAGKAASPKDQTLSLRQCSLRYAFLDSEVNEDLSHIFRSNCVLVPAAAELLNLALSLIEERRSCIDLIRRHPDLRLLHWCGVLQAHCKPHRTLRKKFLPRRQAHSEVQRLVVAAGYDRRVRA